MNARYELLVAMQLAQDLVDGLPEGSCACYRLFVSSSRWHTSSTGWETHLRLSTTHGRNATCPEDTFVKEKT